MTIKAPRVHVGVANIILLVFRDILGTRLQYRQGLLKALKYSGHGRGERHKYYPLYLQHGQSKFVLQIA